MVHNGIIENFAELRAELERGGVEFASDTDTETVAHLVAAHLAEHGGDARRRGAGGLPAAAGRVHARPPRRRAARRRRRRAPQLAARASASATARCSSAATSRRSSSSPARRSSSGRTRSSRSARDGYTITDFDGIAGRGQAVPHRLGSRRRREGRLRLLHAQGDPGAARRGARHAARAPGRRADRARRAAPRPAGAARHRQGVHRRVRHRLPLRADRQAGHRALDAHPGRGRDGLGVPLSRPGARPADAGRRRSASRARPRTRSRPCGTPATSGRRCSRSATRTARRSRASPTPCSTRTPGPRSGWRRPRRSSRRSPRSSSSGSRSRRRAARSTATRSSASTRRCAGCRTRSQQVLATVEPVRELARDIADSQGRAVPRPPRRLPGGARGRAQAQGTRLHARRGLPGRRAQARPDRAHRGRACRSS